MTEGPLQDRCQVMEASFSRWRSGETPSGTTDATWINVIVGSSGAVRLLEYSMGPETEALYGTFDHGRWIDVPADDVSSLLGRLVGMLFDNGMPIAFDDLGPALADWSIEFTEGEGEYSVELEKIA